MEHVISTEFHSRKAVGREAGESSKRITEEVPIQTTLSKRFKMVRKAGKNVKNKSPMPKIQKVIFLLRNDKDFEKCYEPRVISLGPIHHGKPKYQPLRKNGSEAAFLKRGHRTEKRGLWPIWP